MPLVGRLLGALALLTVGVTFANIGHAAERAPVTGAWASRLIEGLPRTDDAFAATGADDRDWTRVAVPHNWQGYAYARQVRNGARHGTAWYRKHLTIARPRAGERIALRFEGANSYATVWLNGGLVGRHAGGLTAFALDVTDAVRSGDNVLAVRIDNPAGITDLPWVSGDDQPENGFAEGSQPFGLFRPVQIERSAALRIRPDGIYGWGRPGAIDAARAILSTRVEVENRSATARTVAIETALVDPAGRTVATARTVQAIAAGAIATVEGQLPAVARPRLWSPASPTLYTLRARILDGTREVDRQSVTTGLRTVRIAIDAQGQRRLVVNGEPVFLRGVAEYEHLLGTSHAFSDVQVAARVAQARAAGFNAFRDAHYPHNLRYGDAIARAGMMWWPQFSAHIWFDNPAFRANFRTLLEDWVRERRNNPALFLWGLQNESRLPKAFAQEMAAAIRTLDPTATAERPIVTCNGGEGADWNVPQNWSGTYGGDPAQFGVELAKQGLVGEYGGWRSLGLHDEAPHAATPPASEEHFTRLMQTKAGLAETVRDRSIGLFQWLLGTHENPGRPMRADGTQIWDGVRALDHVGPANNKGLMTLWGEPLDAWYMYRALGVPASTAPMVHIVSHTWPDRWRGPGKVSGIEVYSNCFTVELFNDARGTLSLGRRTRDAEGRFVWNDVPLRYDVLSATCIENGTARARDAIVLDDLPAAPDRASLVDPVPLTRAAAGYRYLHRVNVGGDAVTDAAGIRWAADRRLAGGTGWGWRSWAEDYPELDPMLGSRRTTYEPVAGTDSPALFRDFRYGHNALGWRFAVPDGRYRVELYFAEPWYGRAGVDARGWRVFDVAINGRTVVDDLDIFAEAGFAHALRKVVTVDIRGGTLAIDFPEVKAGQAILSAIAIASRTVTPVPVEAGSDLVAPLARDAAMTIGTLVDNGMAATGDEGVRWTALPYALLDADQLRPDRLGGGGGGTAIVTVRADATLYRAIPDGDPVPGGWRTTGHHAILTGTTPIPMPVAFVARDAARGSSVAVPRAMPVLVRRNLPSPYAPGNFTFTKDRTLFEAEDTGVSLSDATRESVVRGHSGPAYVRLDKGRVAWRVETGAAARHRIAFRYQSSDGAATGRVVLRDASGIAIVSLPVAFARTAGEWGVASVETPGFVNAGSYRLELEAGGVLIDFLRFE